MKQRIEAVQRVFWWLCAGGVLVVLIGVPLGHDAEMMKVLEELRSFRAGFDERAIAATLLSHARDQGRLPLAEIAERVAGEGVPRVVAEGPPVEPRASVDLATLGSVHALALPGAKLEIALPDRELIALSLGWRLARATRTAAPDTRWVLRRVAFETGAASDADVAREREAEAARVARLAAERAAEEAARAHSAAEELVEARRKWRAPWKAQMKAMQARDEALAARDARAAERDAARARDEELARAAQGFRAAAAHAASAHGVVTATLDGAADGRALTLLLPVPLVRRWASVGQLRGADFPAARASSLWDELAGSSVEAGIATVMRRFSWHYNHVVYAGAKFGGTTALQIAPALFVVLLGFFLRRTRGVAQSYNPFDVPHGAVLPAVGFGARPLDLVPLLVLPIVGSALCAWSLVQLGEIVVVPVLSGIFSIALGSWAFQSLGALARLREEVTRTHSRVPDAPKT